MSFNQDVAMDSSDSRKRPLDGENEGGISKKSNQGPDGGIHVKVLVPSIAAGAIIGKGGETIAQIQKEAGAKMKMSKANDYYPGTTERVCLMTGTHDQVNRVADFVLEKIREKPDPNPRPVDGELKVNQERHKQVKILVPNSTAGMIIGKSGSFIKQIKDDSGAYVQISQKAKDMNLQERCVTIAGDEVQNKKALQMIIQKITEDPQSGSCPNISYTDFHGPVASANPTGSPFAGAVPQRMEVGGQGYSPGQNFPGGLLGAGGNFTNGGGPNNIGSGINNLNLNSSIGTNGRGIAMPGLESLRTTLRASGFSDMAIEEICQAMCTLSSYNLLGMLGMGMGQGGAGPSTFNLGGGTGLGGLNLGATNSLFGNNGSLFGPVGSGGNHGAGDGSLFTGATNMGGMANMAAQQPQQQQGAGDNHSSSLFSDSYSTPGYNMGHQGMEHTVQQQQGGDEKGDPTKKEMEVHENIVGAILGPGGRDIVELQQNTRTTIIVSKKGVYAPNSRNRIVTISGNPQNIAKAQYMIQLRISQEESKRARQAPR